MAAPAPPRQPIQIAKPGGHQRPGGLLPVQPSTFKGNATPQSKATPKNTTPRLKVVIRRLPPGLTTLEFVAALGEEWKLGDRIDWESYVQGKVSKDLAKPSRPSRAYLHINKQEDLASLSEKIRNTSFLDGKASHNDSCLLGPPTVEFAPCGKVPTNKPRKDARQGTIDQEQDFKDFLQELTAPLPRPVPVDTAAEKALKSEEKTVTPLIQYLRDKKANKGKEQATAKGGKHGRQESKDNKANGPSDKKSSKGKDVTGDKKPSNPKVEKATREAVKVLSKQAAAKTAAAQSPATAATATSTSAPGSPLASPARPERKRERGNMSAAAKILQRDLGLGGAPTRRKRDVASASSPGTPTTPKELPVKTSVATTQSATSASASPVTPAPPTGPRAVQTPTGPAASRNQQKPIQATTQSKHPSPAPVVTPTATQVFLKHANPSQGVTESLLNEAFSAFGAVTKVEIDKKKGFAYVDFAEPGSLQKAIAASPVKVAQGQVVVLERKTGTSLQNRNTKPGPQGGQARGGATAGRGGRGRGRGGKPPSESAKSSTAASPATPSVSSAEPSTMIPTD